jgi:hypothetical protein
MDGTSAQANQTSQDIVSCALQNPVWEPIKHAQGTPHT